MIELNLSGLKSFKFIEVLFYLKTNIPSSLHFFDNARFFCKSYIWKALNVIFLKLISNGCFHKNKNLWFGNLKRIRFRGFEFEYAKSQDVS